MEGIIIAVVVVLAYFSFSIYSRIQWRKQNQKRVRESFGKKPEHKEKDINKIRFYLENQQKEPDIDQVTWNDLSMDEVFWRINNCASSAGEEILYDTMHRLEYTDAELDKLEESIQYFSVHEKERNEILVFLLNVGKRDASYYIPPYMASIQENKVGSNIAFRICQILPLVFLSGLAVTKNLIFAALFAGNLITNILTYALMKMRYETNLAMLGTICSVLKTGADISKLKCREHFCESLEEPLKYLRKTGGSVERMQSAQNNMLASELGILEDYLLGATLWHLTAYNKSINMLIQYREEYGMLYETVGNIDMAISIASFRKSIPFYTTPEFAEKREVLSEDLYHPLLEDPVCNSINWKKNSIITGSNASGKSTFIKAMAVNTILAQNIHTCMAKSMKMPRADVVTSMAVSDDILSGDSYFIKEIKYLKRMLAHLNPHKCTICIVDEILRGTNTKERIAASKAILKYLSKENCLAMAASHDQELTGLLSDIYDNYHFSEKIGQQDIEFDYKLYLGPAVSNNAIRLLEYMGFPKKIIADAKGL